jgi:gas vesicle protein GvpL/GvpF
MGPTAMTEQHATWVYAVVPAAVPAPQIPAGISGEPVRLLAHDGIAAAVGSVSRGEIGEGELLNHIRDPAWLERAARRHHRVVCALAEAVPTVPFRLATVYHEDGGVRRFLEEGRQRLLTALETVTNRTEWGVQAYVTTAPPSPPVEQVGSQPGGPGTAYLLRQREKRTERERERLRIWEAVDRIESSLMPFAVASRTQPPAGAGPQPAKSSMVMNVSYLVDDGLRADFVATAQRLEGTFPGVWLRVTGPWPGYSFVDVDGGQ